jgi:hypothetical protein
VDRTGVPQGRKSRIIRRVRIITLSASTGLIRKNCAKRDRYSTQQQKRAKIHIKLQDVPILQIPVIKKEDSTTTTAKTRWKCAQSI